MIQDSGKIKEFTDLNAWKEGHRLVLATYRLTRDFPRTELFGLSNQIQRAAVSITSNIAEGFGRQTYKEKVQYYYIAQGSLTEFKNQLFIARDLNYIKQSEFDKIHSLLISTHKLLQGLIKKSKSFLNLES